LNQFVNTEIELLKNQIQDERSAVINQNNDLKLTMLKILYQIQLFEEGEALRNKEVDVNYIYNYN
jgi:hypothetical protein